MSTAQWIGLIAYLGIFAFLIWKFPKEFVKDTGRPISGGEATTILTLLVVWPLTFIYLAVYWMVVGLLTGLTSLFNRLAGPPTETKP